MRRLLAVVAERANTVAGASYTNLRDNDDEKRINAVVLLTDPRTISKVFTNVVSNF